MLYEDGFPEVQNSAKYYDLQELLGKKKEYLLNNKPNQIQLTLSLSYIFAPRVNIQTETKLRDFGSRVTDRMTGYLAPII